MAKLKKSYDFRYRSEIKKTKWVEPQVPRLKVKASFRETLNNPQLFLPKSKIICPSLPPLINLNLFLKKSVMKVGKINFIWLHLFEKHW